MSLVYGIGFNDRKLPSRVDGKQPKEYKLWCRVLERCNSNYWTAYPSYNGVICSENFKNYTFFYEWCHEQVGFDCKDDKGNSWQLDKDILVKGNKVYSEDTCVFVPHRVNNLIIKSEATRGDYPLGVCWHKSSNKFVALCRDGRESRGQKHLGYFNTPEEAFQAYKTFKEGLIKEVANEYKCKIDNRLYQALISYRVETTD